LDQAWPADKATDPRAAPSPPPGARGNTNTQEAGRQGMHRRDDRGGEKLGSSRVPGLLVACTASDRAVSLSRNSMAQPQQEEAGDHPVCGLPTCAYICCATTLHIERCMGTLQCWEDNAMCVCDWLMGHTGMAVQCLCTV
jgi:hypothetical protein